MPAAVLHHAVLDSLQRITFDYFLHETNPANGLVADKTQEGTPASIAAVGLALAAYPVGVEHGLITRDEATARTLAAFFSGPARMAPTPTPPGTTASITTFSTWPPAAGPGGASCRRPIPLF